MSPYKRAWLYILWVAITAIVIVSTAPYAKQRFGFYGELALLALWLCNSIPTLLFFKCRNCGVSIFSGTSSTSLFKTNEKTWQINSIIPTKCCKKCGNDYRVK